MKRKILFGLLIIFTGITSTTTAQAIVIASPQIIAPIDDGSGGNAPGIVERCSANALAGRTCFG